MLTARQKQSSQDPGLNMIEVHILNEQKDLSFCTRNIPAIVQTVLEIEGQVAHEVHISFVDEEKISALHDAFFDDPSTTDCISLPIDDEDEVHYRVLGEIFVCPKTALNYSHQNMTDPLEETCLYLVHGLLHLLGYDDIEEADRLEMRKAEERCMIQLKEKSLILKDGDAL